MAENLDLASAQGFAFPNSFYPRPPAKPFAKFIRPCVMLQGQPSIPLSPDDLICLNAPLNLCLIGKFIFSDTSPSDDDIRSWIRSRGCSANTRFGRSSKNCVVFFFNDAHEYATAFSNIFFNVGTHTMRLTKWDQHVSPTVDSPLAPVWVEFPDLPYRFFDKELLFSLAACLGRPLQLHVDTFNLSRLDTAKVLIELDVTAPVPPCILLGDSSDGFWQPVRTPTVPPFCTSCKIFGHLLDACSDQSSPPSRNTLPLISAAAASTSHATGHRRRFCTRRPLRSAGPGHLGKRLPRTFPPDSDDSDE